MNTQLPANLENLSPEKAFANMDAINAILESVDQVVSEHKPDISTEEGRAAIKSLAYSVARSKTFLDDKGKELTAEWKAKSRVVDDARKHWRDTMDALKKKARKPLDDYEAAEEARTGAHKEKIRVMNAFIDDAGYESDQDTLQAWITRLDEYKDHDFEEYAEPAKRALDSATSVIAARFQKLKEEEAEKAELARLRQQEEEREKKEREDQIRTEAAKLEREKAEQEKRAAAVAAELAHQQEVAARQRAEREKAEAIERAEQEKKQAAEHAAMERERAIEAERVRMKAEAAKAVEIEMKRQKDVNHRNAINSELSKALIDSGLLRSTEEADEFIEAVNSGDIPHLKITY